MLFCCSVVMMWTSSGGIACPACCRFCNNGVMSCMSVAFAWEAEALVCICTYWFPSACLNGLCIVLTNGCWVDRLGSIVVVKGDGICGLGV